MKTQENTKLVFTLKCSNLLKYEAWDEQQQFRIRASYHSVTVRTLYYYLVLGSTFLYSLWKGTIVL